jgi:large repetitive protein
MYNFLKSCVFIIILFLSGIQSVANMNKDLVIAGGNSFLTSPSDPITATIEGNTSFCKNASNVRIIFRGSGGTAPYTFTYQVNGNEISVSGKNDTAQVVIAASSAGSFTYKIAKVKDNSGSETSVDVSKTITVNELPNVDFTFSPDNVCSGTSIQFTSSVNGIGAFAYTWNFGDGQTSTVQNPSHIYNSLGCSTKVFTVSLTVTNDSLTVAKSKPITVIQQPDISFFDVNSPYDQFSNCKNASVTNPTYSIKVDNNSPSKTCITSYTLDWGDGSSPVLNVTFPIEHKYTRLGAFKMAISAIGTNNCSSKVVYVVKNQTNPSVGITSPGTTTNLCAPTDELNFEIAKWGSNSPGTIYSVDYGDNSPQLTFTQEELMNSSYYSATDPSSSANYPIPHVYSKSNCPNTAFKVTVTASNACSSTNATVDNITVLSKPIADFEVPKACLNSNLTFKNITKPGNNPGCSQTADYTWNFGDGSPVKEITNSSLVNTQHTYSSPGTYNISLKVKNFCGEDSITHKITVNPLPTAAISGGDTVCQNSVSPIITFTGANGVAPYTFTYKINANGSASTKTITTTANNNSITLSVPTDKSGLFTYTLVSVQEGSAGCSQTQTGSVTFKIIPAPTATIAGTKNVCLNDDPPFITFTGSNGTPPYTFTYNVNGGVGQTIATVSGNSITVPVPTNSVATYKYKLLKVQDNSTESCSKLISDSVTIKVNQPPELVALNNYEYCNGATTSVINFTNTIPITGTTYSWTNSNTSIGLASSSTGSIPAFKAKNSTANPVTSTITVTPKANGCNGQPRTFTITVNPSADVVFSPASQITCSGESTSEVILSSSTTGASIAWTTTQPTGISETIQLSGSDTIPTQILTNTTNAPISILYKAKATIAGVAPCLGAEYTFTRTVNPKPIIIETLRDTICSGFAFSVTPSNIGGNSIPSGTKYKWGDPQINPPGTITGGSVQNTPQSLISQTLVNPTISPATATYSATPVFNSCEGSPFQVIVKVNPNSGLNPLKNLVACNNERIDDIVFSGGIPGTVYKWEVDNPAIGMKKSGEGNIPAFTATNAGNSPIIATIGVTPTFNGQVFDCGGKQVKFTITINPAAQVNNPGNITICSKQTTNIKFSTKNTGGITTYKWINDNTKIGLLASGNGDISFMPVFDGDNTITSKITVISTYTNNGLTCDGPPEQFWVSVSPLIVNLTGKKEIDCAGASTGAISIDVRGGEKYEIAQGIYDYKYQWSGPHGYSNLQKDLTNIAAGNYNLVVTDRLGCTTNFAATINERNMPSITAVKTPISCYGADDASIRISIEGDPSLYKVEWSNFATGLYHDNLSAGDYFITVTDTNNCHKVIEVNIPEAKVFNVNPIVKNVSCNGAKDGSIKLNYVGDIDSTLFSWSDGSTSGINRNNIGSGTYNVTIVGGNKCMINRTFVITEPLPLNIKSEITHPLDCVFENGGAIKLTVGGGTPPYNYLWSTGAKIKDLDNLPAGNYAVTVIDSAGCVKTTQYVITRPSPIEINLSTKFDYDCTTKNVKEICTAKVTGGMPPYKFTWSSGITKGANNETMETSQGGTYKVSVADTLGCSAEYTFNTKIPEFGIKEQLIDCNQHSSQFNAIVANDTGNYSYEWDFGDGTKSDDKNPIHAYSSFGIYSVKLKITDIDNSCVTTYDQIVDNTQPAISVDKEPKFCVGDSIILYATGASRYKWDDGTWGDSSIIKYPGNYNVVGYSEKGCTDTFNFKASYFDLMNYKIQSDKTQITKEDNSIHLWSDDIPFSNYHWSFGDGLFGQGVDVYHTYEIKKDGYYDISLNIINPNGCLEKDTTRIWINLNSIPNTFTPNGDGINDIYLKGWHVQIYNRNSILLYEGMDGWDGKYKGKAVDNDTYFVVVFDSSESETKYKTGYVTVIR